MANTVTLGVTSNSRALPPNTSIFPMALGSDVTANNIFRQIRTKNTLPPLLMPEEVSIGGAFFRTKVGITFHAKDNKVESKIRNDLKREAVDKGIKYFLNSFGELVATTTFKDNVPSFTKNESLYPLRDTIKASREINIPMVATISESQTIENAVMCLLNSKRIGIYLNGEILLIEETSIPILLIAQFPYFAVARLCEARTSRQIFEKLFWFFLMSFNPDGYDLLKQDSFYPPIVGKMEFLFSIVKDLKEQRQES